VHTASIEVPVLKPLRAESGGTIRPYAASDKDAVATLLVRAFQSSDAEPKPGMAAYLNEVYLDAPWFDPELASRVMAMPDGTITGFVGVSAMPMRMGDRRIRAALISSLAVDPASSDPMTGPRLLRDVRSGPQDAVVSDRSNAVAVALLRSLSGEVFRNYSFDWIRTIRPVGLAIDTLANRFGALRLLAPLARPFDAFALSRSLRDDQVRWIAPSRSRASETFADHDADEAEIAALIRRFLEAFALRPDWSDADLHVILGDAARKADMGDFVSRVVTSPNGQPVGFYLYHLRRGQVAQVLQIMAQKGREGIVIDRAIADAADRGAVAIRGRSQPALIDALMERRAIFVPELATVVYSRDEAVLKAFREGTAFFTGLAGENWMRLNGDRF